MDRERIIKIEKVLCLFCKKLHPDYVYNSEYHWVEMAGTIDTIIVCRICDNSICRTREPDYLELVIKHGLFHLEENNLIAFI